jgi:hypothetical protein
VTGRYASLHSNRCGDCGLPDPYNGDGDGIGSCRCIADDAWDARDYEEDQP